MKLPPYVFISIGFVAAATLLFLLGLVLFYDRGLFDTIVVPLLVGVLSSVVATLAISLLLTANAGIWGKYLILRSHDEIYQEAESCIKYITESAGPRLRDVQVTALVRKETKDDDTYVISYMKALDTLLGSTVDDDTLVYRMMGRFGEWIEENGQRRLVNYDKEVKERLTFFKREESKRRVLIAAFDEAWPVDILVVRNRTIIAFRSHSTGALKWGLRIRDERVAERARHWLDELWGDDRKTMLLWDGRELRPE